jgi:peptide deformylase
VAVLEIVKYPSKILGRKAMAVQEVTPEITKLLDDMAETMYAAPGVGLAAPQVGAELRCIVVDTGIKMPDGSCRQNLAHFINPEITKKEGEIEWEEGCLSVPEFTYKIKRANSIHVKALDRLGRPLELDAEGLFAVAIQHEIDHLDGRLIIDSVSRLKRAAYLREQKRKHLKEKEPVYL